MEKRKESLKAAKLCRFCLSQDQSLDSLYDRNRALNNAINLHVKILSCVSIEVFPSDKMPGYICNRCKTLMNLFYDFKQIVGRADESIFHYLQNGTPMETIEWPTTLTKILPCPDDIKVVKTLESGATIQVSSQEVSDSDEEDANVYSIKIGDGLDDTNTARIKVVTGKKRDDAASAQSGNGINVLFNESNVSSPSGGRQLPRSEARWPCPQCHRSYPLQQLLALHRRRQHRPRTVRCDRCDQRFFSKYDLSAHLLRHTDETPFRCVVCDESFKRQILLRRHEKLAHSELPRRSCPDCPAAFLSDEELQTHRRKHARVHRPHACNKCDKKFREKATLQRHVHVVHEREPAHRCGYCPERFVSLSKLTKHVRSHAGDRPYPCKYCDKSFTKSHHYTRHLRLKHREAAREESYRCDQCDDAFACQDDLIYHSAIHATQNLTCPLCQEKFPNVDDVTAHIKSHVNGVEFMCDYCELVFTTKEKLDDHLVSAHEDEVQIEESEGLDDPEESSMEEMEDDSGMNLKDEGDHMVIEINKGDYVINKTTETEGRSAIDSEESEAGSAAAAEAAEAAEVEAEAEVREAEVEEEEATEDTIETLNKNELKPLGEKSESKSVELKPLIKKTERTEHQPAPVYRRNDEIKRKSAHPAQEAVIEKKEKKCETNSAGANDKSLRLLEKELQDLKRTNSRPEIQKASPKNLEMLRNKRVQMQTSTPKSYTSKASEEKKLALANKTVTQEKKPERRQITKENKEPKDVKESKTNNGNNREDKETPKSVVKNGANNDKNTSDDGVRRSTRPSKVKDYAKMVREQPPVLPAPSSDDDDDYCDPPRTGDRNKIRRPPAARPRPSDVAPRKRGRPRKDSKNSKETPAKIRKDDIDTAEEDKMEEASVREKSSIKEDKRNTDTEEMETNQTTPKTPPEQKSFSMDLLVSPSGQTLKKVPIKALPPGVKPLPLPVNARPVASGELCEMQIGKKVVKVQKIVMTKAEVEAMAKKGLVEMKDGTMVLKQGIKLPTMESVSAKASNLGEGDTGNESLINKKEKAVPTRCDLGDDS